MRKYAFAVAAAFLGTAAGQQVQAADSWAQQIIDDAKLAEKKVARSGVRVASLGYSDFSDESGSKSRRSKSTTAPADRPQESRTRVAALTKSKSDAEPETRRKSLSGGSVSWNADRGCLNGTLRGVLSSLSSNYGPVTVNSTCRSKSHNARVGGASKSYHLDGDAADFRVHSNISAAYASLKGNGDVGGLKHYGGGLFHIDTGPRRSW